MQRSPLNENFSAMLQEPLKVVQSTDLDSPLHKLRVFGDQLWAAALHCGIAIYSPRGQLMHFLKRDYLQFVCGLAETESGDIIVADTEAGLLHLDRKGDFIARLAEGRFSDVATWGDTLYSLEWTKCRIHVHRHVRNHQFIKMDEFPVKHQKGFWGDKLAVNSDSLFVNSWNNHQIYGFSLDGKLQFEAGERGSSNVGMLERPYLCGVDGEGNALVSDWGNSRLQVYNSQAGTWHVLDTGESLHHPLSAVVGNQHLWVAKGKPCKLLTYALQAN